MNELELQKYSEAYTFRFENTMRSKKSTLDLNTVRDRFIILFEKEDWDVMEWAKFLRVSFRTFKSLFMQDKNYSDITIKKFLTGLTTLEKKHKIDKIL